MKESEKSSLKSRILIQLCDALALPSGFCLLEKRMLDVVTRYYFNEFTLEKWKATFKLQRYFEERIGLLFIVFYLR